MPDATLWLLDFDETLATGSITWAIQHTFPKFIRENQLNADSTRLQQVLLDLQERASQNPDPEPLLQALFEAMGWPGELQESLFDDVWSNYQPALFDDVLPFLERLRAKRRAVLVVSNNPRTPAQVQALGLQSYVRQVFTPHTCPDTQPKPHRSLWEYIVAHESDIDASGAVVVGDDPWSDGPFADECGLACWIVDRMNRFSEVRAGKRYQWARSLAEIPV